MLHTFYYAVRRVGFILLFISFITLLHILSFYPQQASRSADCIVVFGAAVWPTSFGPTASHALSDRTLTAASLYKRGLSDCIILSGADSIYGAHEVDIMTDLLLTQDIPEDALILDREGVNTIATINHLDTSKSYILLSNDFHLARIGLLAQRAGLSGQGFTLYAAQYGAGSGLVGLSARYSRESYFVFREGVAWWYYFFTTLI